MQPDDNYLLYDGDCPFCLNYVRMMQLRKAAGPIALLNMRDHPELAARHRAQGYDLNQGMLLHLDGREDQRADCIHRLALLSTGNDLFNRVNATIFSSSCLSKALYPFMRTGRSLTLTLLGKKKML